MCDHAIVVGVNIRGSVCTLSRVSDSVSLCDNMGVKDIVYIYLRNSSVNCQGVEHGVHSSIMPFRSHRRVWRLRSQHFRSREAGVAKPNS